MSGVTVLVHFASMRRREPAGPGTTKSTSSPCWSRKWKISGRFPALSRFLTSSEATKPSNQGPTKGELSSSALVRPSRAHRSPESIQ
jgi:hypothetical protein